MKTLTALMIFVISLSFAGCATTQSGGGAPAAGYTEPSKAKGVKMLTKEDYDRIGVKEMGNPNK